MKTNVPGLVKDSSGMVTNQNLGEYELIKQKRQERKSRAALEARVEALEKQVEYLNKMIAMGGGIYVG